MKYTAVFLLTVCMALHTMAQYVPVNITSTDITKSKPFVAANITVYGTHLGMSKQDALAALKADHSVIGEIDLYNTPSDDVNSTKQMRIYVYAKDAGGEKGNSLLYLIWNEGSAGLSRIVFLRI